MKAEKFTVRLDQRKNTLNDFLVFKSLQSIFIGQVRDFLLI